jgi:hypothetical protein
VLSPANEPGSRHRALAPLGLTLLSVLGLLACAWAWVAAGSPGRDLEPLPTAEEREANPPPGGAQVLSPLADTGALNGEEGRIPFDHSLGDNSPGADSGAQTGPALRLRFLRGTSGRPAPLLSVRVLAAPDPVSDDGSGLVDVGSLVNTAAARRVLGLGRTDSGGWLELPRELARRDLLLDVAFEGEGWDGESYAEPNWLTVEHLPADGTPMEIRVFGPWARFEARVLDPAGNPLSGAVVQFDFESPALASSTRDRATVRVESDQEGLARHALIDAASVGGRLRVRAEGPGSLRSETVEFPPPLSGTKLDLRLTTRARAVVRVETSSGAPLAGAMARLERLDPPYGRMGRSTDHEGKALFSPLEPGRYSASAEDPSTGAGIAAEFLLTQGQLFETRLTLPASALPLAVAGSVRDSRGRAVDWLWVSVCVEGREEQRLPTDAEGRFAYHRAPCGKLRVRLCTAFDGPRVEPEVFEADFGSRDVHFVLGEPPILGALEVSVVDRETGAGLSGVRAILFRDSAAERLNGFVSTLAGLAPAPRVPGGRAALGSLRPGPAAGPAGGGAAGLRAPRDRSGRPGAPRPGQRPRRLGAHARLCQAADRARRADPGADPGSHGRRRPRRIRRRRAGAHQRALGLPGRPGPQLLAGAGAHSRRGPRLRAAVDRSGGSRPRGRRGVARGRGVASHQRRTARAVPGMTIETPEPPTG